MNALGKATIALAAIVIGCKGGTPATSDLLAPDGHAAVADAGPNDTADTKGGGDAGPSDPTSTADSGRSRPKPDSGPFPSTPGVYASISATGMAGTHAFTKSVDCYEDNGLYTMTGGGGSDIIDVHATSAPVTGATLVSPTAFVALFFNDPDGSYYPANDTGTCTLTVDEGWPHVRARFSCSGLVAASSGAPFEVTDGVVVCP